MASTIGWQVKDSTFESFAMALQTDVCRPLTFRFTAPHELRRDFPTDIPHQPSSVDHIRAARSRSGHAALRPLCRDFAACAAMPDAVHLVG